MTSIATILPDSYNKGLCIFCNLGWLYERETMVLPKPTLDCADDVAKHCDHEQPWCMLYITRV